jgi:hypothetical protein
MPDETGKRRKIMSKIDDYKDAVEKDKALKQFIDQNIPFVSESVQLYDYDYRISFQFKSMMDTAHGSVRIPYHSERIGEMIAKACSVKLAEIMALAVLLSRDDAQEKASQAQDEAIEFIKTLGAKQQEQIKGENHGTDTRNSKAPAGTFGRGKKVSGEPGS